MKKNEVAIISDVMMTFGGAETVVMKFMEMYPNADFYTLFISCGALKKIESKFPNIKVRTSIFQRLINGDNVSKYISIIKLLSWVYWEYLDLSQYKLIISSSHSFMSKNVKKGKGAKHLSYIHTPPRYLYEEYNEIGWIKDKPWSFLFWPWKKLLQFVDKRGSKRPDILIANSQNVAKRINKYYGREAVVVYPPVEVKGVNKTHKKGSYFVCLSRLVKQKGIDLAVNTCTKNNFPLIVIGKGDELNNLRDIAGSNVEFVESCDDNNKFKILSGAKALIYPSRDEDFGIVPVEALKMGVPVIAFNSGGVKETVFEGKNGIFFDKYCEDMLAQAIKKFEKMNISEKECKKSVRQYSSYRFMKEIRNLI